MITVFTLMDFFIHKVLNEVRCLKAHLYKRGLTALPEQLFLSHSITERWSLEGTSGDHGRDQPLWPNHPCSSSAEQQEDGRRVFPLSWLTHGEWSNPPHQASRFHKRGSQSVGKAAASAGYLNTPGAQGSLIQVELRGCGESSWECSHRGRTCCGSNPDKSCWKKKCGNPDSGPT